MSSFRTCLKILWGNKMALMVYVVLLSLLGVLMGLESGHGNATTYERAQANVAVIDRDGSVLSRALGAHIERGNDVEAIADDPLAIQDAVAKGSVSYILVIPNGWGQGLMDAAAAGTSVPDLETYVSYQSAEGSLVDVETTGYAQGLYGNAATLGGSQKEVVSLTDGAMEEHTVMSIARQDTTPLSDAFELACKFSTYPILAGISVCIAVLMESLNAEAVLDRRLVAPTTTRRRNGGLLAVCSLLGVGVWAWTFGLNVLAFAREELVVSFVQVMLVGGSLAAYAFFSVAIGFLLGQLRLSTNATNAFANIAGMALSFLGGAWVSTSLLPDTLVTLAHFTPAYWCCEVVKSAVSMVNVSWETVLPLLGQIGVVTLFGLAVLTMALLVGRTKGREELA